jgi:6-phosphofructokinase 1
VAKKRRIGVLTGGGDCPGLNAGIRAVTKTAIAGDYEVLGIQHGWQGLLKGEYEILDRIRTSAIIDKGGTILGTSRVSPFQVEDGPQQVLQRFKEWELEMVVAFGGEGTLSIASKMSKMGLPVIGIPKTIDNDVYGTDFSIGFQTAVQIATEALDRLRSTAESHHRVMLLEVMGRRTGWIATYSGMANGADAILIPEIPIDDPKMTELCDQLVLRNRRGAPFSIVVVAEGVTLGGYSANISTGDTGASPRFGGIANPLGEIIQHKTGLETRVSSLGYVQRGGTPVAYDRSLATAFGVRAARLACRGVHGIMTSLRGNRVTTIPLSEMEGKTKTVDLHIYKIAEVFFG